MKPPSEDSLHWPPKYPPSDREIAAAWHQMHCDTLAFLRRHIQESSVRSFLKKLDASLLEVTIMRESDHAENVTFELQETSDKRPHFQPDPETNEWDSGIESAEDSDEHEEGGGGAGMIDQESPFTEDTRFCLSMEYAKREAKTDHSHFAISNFTYSSIAIEPGTAMRLLNSMQGGVKVKRKKEMKEYRRIVADALVFKFIEKTVEESAEDETDDGGVIPTWRNRETDPSLDVLNLCPHLRQLYMQICGFDDYMP